ncbi:hypothetical protein [Streptomyces naphthomycinicus]|uniref:hypothetical protein n=1 Tax=Streptomyces naphthomycinicus TaxID=2872625 RepID=UPI001CEC5ABE|nr:hypothetical protein [Streptomyces sp. TML10]
MSFNDAGHQAPRGFRARVEHVGQWLYRRRHIAALHALRGASYAAGTSGVGLIVWWIETRH